MRRVAVVAQAIVAVVLVVLWLRWNPLSSDCPSGAECTPTFDPFTETQREPSGSVFEEPDHWPLQVELGRCARVKSLRGGEVECIYPPGAELRLWVVHRHVDQVEVSIDGRPIAAPLVAMDEEPGRGLRVTLADDTARQLTVQVPEEEPWSAPLRATTRLTERERAQLADLDSRAFHLEAHMALGRLQMLPELRRLVADMLDQGWLSRAVETVLATSFHLTYRSGRPDLAQELIEGLPSLLRYPWGRAATSIYLGHALQEQGRLVDAVRGYRVGGHFAVRMQDPGLQLDALSMYASVLAQLGYFEAAAHWGARVLELARAHGRLTDQVDVMSTVGWSNLELRQAGQAHDEPEPWFREAIALLERGADVTPGVSVDKVAPARLGLAKQAILDGEPGAAIDTLDRIVLEHLTPDERVEAHDIRLQSLLAGAGGDLAPIEQALASLEQAAAQVVSPALRWRAAVRRGAVRRRAGDHAGALAAYEQSEALLDRLIPLAMLGLSGEARPVLHTEGTQRLVALWLERGNPAKALCVARRAQARLGQLARLFGRLGPDAQAALRPRVAGYLRAKREYEQLLRGDRERSAEDSERALREARRRHQQLEHHAAEILSVGDAPRRGSGCDELTPRRPGELLLGLYPHLGDLLLIAQDDEGTTHRLLSDHDTLMRADDARWLGTLLFSPLDDRLMRASRVRVVASGEAASIDVHALPWRGQPLVASVPVVYGLELPRTQSSVPERAPRPRALVVADPRARGAEVEAEAVERILASERWEVVREMSTARAAHTLREQLAEVQHFHYAGHAYYDRPEAPMRVTSGDAGDDADVRRLWPPYPGGAAAEPSYIPLGGRERLDVQDILMMERVPGTVVLMGCATGVHDERTAYGGFSLATAFLGAGAEVVVASTRRVDGTEASLVGRGLHTHRSVEAVREPGAWFMHGLSWARARGLSEVAIADYRVFVP